MTKRPSLEQQVLAGIVAAREVYREPGWLRWADAWIAGRDRTAAAAEAAAVGVQGRSRVTPGSESEVEFAAQAAELAALAARSVALIIEGATEGLEILERIASGSADQACVAAAFVSPVEAERTQEDAEQKNRKG